MSKEYSGKSMQQNDAAYASDDLAAKIAVNLEKIKGGGEPEPDDDSTPVTDDSQTDDSDSTFDDSDSQTDDTDDSTFDDSGGESADDKTESPTIPEHLFRAALHQGWSQEDITGLYKQNPKLAEKTFEKLHSDVNNLSQQFSQLGQMARSKPQQQQTQLQFVQPNEPQDFIDVAKLRKEYEDNPLIDMIETLNNGLKMKFGSNAIPQQQQPTIQQNTFQEDMAALQEISSFLGARDMENYNDFYGSVVDANNFPILDWRSLAPGQQANRQALVNEADLILAGAELIGKRMSISQALTMAHLKLTAPLQEQIARQKVIGQMKKRSKGVTLRSGGTKKAANISGQKSEEQLITDTEERLKQLNF